MNKRTMAAALFLTCFTCLSHAATPTTQTTLTGRVLDPNGKPIPNAQIDLAGPNYTRVTSDAKGNYSATLRPSGEYRIGARADGFITLEYYRGNNVISLNGGTVTRDIVMQPGVAVRVRVVDLVGVPVIDASVDMTNNAQDYRERIMERKSTDAAGRVMFTVPVSRDPYTVIASLADYEPAHTTVTAPALDKPQDAELTILPGIPVKGLAICNDGKPASGWDIVAYPDWWGSNYIPRGAKIDKDGSFMLKDVGPGKYRLQLSMSRTLQDVATVNFPPSSQPIRVDIPFPSPSQRVQFTGRVRITGPRPDYISVNAQSVGDGGREWFNAQVNFGARPRRAATGPATKQVTPAANEGTFTFDQIPAGTYNLNFSSQQIEYKTIENVKIPGEFPVVELKAVGKSRLTGNVTDAATAKPIQQFGIRSKKVEQIGTGPNYNQDRDWMQVSSPEGKFDLELVGAGVYQVQVSADGYAWLWSDKVRIENAGGVGNANIKLTRGGALAGIVVDPDGKPVAGAKVIPLSKAQTLVQRGENRFEGEAGAVTTDARGVFSIKNLSPGDESVKIVHEKLASQTAENFKIIDAKTTDAGTIKLKSGGTVEGTVFDENGKPAKGMTLMFQDRTGYGGGDDERVGRLATATSDAQGKFRVEHLPEQPVFVILSEAWKRGGMLRRTVRPLDGKVARLDFGGTTPLKGRLFKDGKPAASARVNLSPYNPHFGPVMSLARTDEQGRFTFMGMPPGNYILYAESVADRGDWLNIRDLTVTGAAQELGDVAADVGDVVVTLTADEPSDLKAVNSLWVSTDIPGKLHQTHITTLTKEGATNESWRGKNVPVGRFTVQTASNEQTRVSVIAPFERKAGEKEKALALKLPRRSAEVTVRFTGTPPGERQERYAMLQREDGRIKAFASAKSPTDTPTIQLPPGKYRLMDGFTERPREGAAPIEVKDGAPATIDVDFSQAAKSTGPRVVHLEVWESTGVLVVGPKVTLSDGAGKPAESAGDGGVGPTFNVSPGKYKVTVERAGQQPHTQEIEIDAIADPSKAAVWKVVHIVLP